MMTRSFALIVPIPADAPLRASPR